MWLYPLKFLRFLSVSVYATNDRIPQFKRRLKPKFTTCFNLLSRLFQASQDSSRPARLSGSNETRSFPQGVRFQFPVHREHKDIPSPLINLPGNTFCKFCRHLPIHPLSDMERDFGNICFIVESLKYLKYCKFETWDGELSTILWRQLWPKVVVVAMLSLLAW